MTIRSMSEKRRAKLAAEGNPFPFSTITKKSAKQVKRSPMKQWKRKPSDFARIYGSRARVKWVKSLPCCACSAINVLIGEASAGRSENAHTETGGIGYKADFDTIVPLCPSHHKRYDRHLAPFDNEPVRQAFKDFARVVEATWQRVASRLSGETP